MQKSNRISCSSNSVFPVHIYIYILVLALIPSGIYSQTNSILTFNTNDLLSAPTETQAQVDTITSDGAYKFVGFYDVNNLATVQNEGKLLLTFHHDSLPDTNYVFKAKDVTYSNSSYYWFGESTSNTREDIWAPSFFHASKFSENSYLFSFNLQGYSFKGASLANNYFAVFEYLQNDVICGVDDEDSQDIITGPVSNLLMKNCDDNCEIDILFLYTYKAKQKARPSIQKEIDAAIRQTETIFKNSGITDCHVRLNVLDPIEVVFPISNYTDGLYNQNSKSKNAVGHLENDFSSLRDAHNADVVFLIDGDELLNITNAYGIVRGRDMLSYEMYSIVSISALNNSRYSFSHELAHLLAARHDPDADPEANNTNYNGYYWKSNRWYHHTVMGVLNRINYWGNLKTNQSRIPYYSNPYITYYDGKNHKVTGTVNDATAFAFINNSCTIAEMKTSTNPEPFIAYINGDKFACPAMNTSLDVVVLGGNTGQNVYTYEWFKSTDGINYSNVLSTNPTYFVSAPWVAGDVVFVKVKVTNGSTTIQNVATITASTNPYGLPCALKTNITSVQEIIKSELISVFPNPASETITIKSKDGLKQGDFFTIYGVDGKPAIQLVIPSNTPEYQLNISQLAVGYYIIKAQTATNPATFVSFIKTK